MLGKVHEIRKMPHVKRWNLSCQTNSPTGDRISAVPPSRIMYIEWKAGMLDGPARIGRVTFSRTRATLYYKGKSFQSLKGKGFKSNYFETESGDEYWISGPRHDGEDRLYGGNVPIDIDEDCREEYWTKIRKKPEFKSRTTT